VTVPPSISFAGPEFDQPTVATMTLRTHVQILVVWQLHFFHLWWLGVQRRLDCIQAAAAFHGTPHALAQTRHEWRIVLFNGLHGIAWQNDFV
jgi:hypothetical protein